MRELTPDQVSTEPGCDYMAEYGKRCGHPESAHGDVTADDAGYDDRYCADCTEEFNEGVRPFEAICDNGPMFYIPGTPARSLLKVKS